MSTQQTMAHNEDAFQYNTRLRGREIRLLFLEPHEDRGSDAALLKIKLVEENLDTAVFDALSYVWGDQAEKVHTRCNGKDLSVGQNLHAALAEYRCRGHLSRGLWADAICINQADNGEKTDQVRMMGDIYSAASRTIIWLGPFEPGDAEAIRLVEFAYKSSPAERRRKEEGSRYGFPVFGCSDRGLPGPFKDRDIHPTWKSLLKILIYPWFSRIWVVQELLLSRNPQMWRGGENISVAAILWMAKQLGECTDIKAAMEVFSQAKPRFHGHTVAVRYFRFREGGLRPLWANVFTTSGMEAGLVVDRFFALVGISSKNLPSSFVDYTRALEDVASQVGLMILLGSPEAPGADGLDFLSDVPSLCLRNQQIRLPTWVPNTLSAPQMGLRIAAMYPTWRLRRRYPQYPMAEFQLVVGQEGSSNVPRPLILAEFPYRYSKVRELLVKAAVFDKVKAVVSPVDGRVVFDESFKSTRGPDEYSAASSTDMLRFVDRIRLLSDSALHPKDSIMSGHLFEPFWRTLVYNRTADDMGGDRQPLSTVGCSFAYWYMLRKLYVTRRWEQSPITFEFQKQMLRQLAAPFSRVFDHTYGSRSFLLTETGRIGWAPPTASPGDAVAMFQGCRIPFVAKSVRGSEVWEFAGGCYVHGCMDGEIWRAEGLEWKFMRFV